MNITILADYIRTKKINLDLGAIKASACTMHDLATSKFFDGYLNPNNQLDHSVYSKYNLLMYPLDQFHELYNEIKIMFHEMYSGNDKYYIQCWVNFYYHNDFIEWHRHSPAEHRAYHGFFCVDCEPSYTRYRIEGHEGDVLVNSENNLLVISPSGKDIHRTAPWPDQSRPRITIAFDIIPKEFIKHDEFLNHWIPI